MSQGTAFGRFEKWLRHELIGDQPILGLLSGVLMGSTEVFVSLSLGALIFSGPLEPYLPQGIGMSLFTASLIMILTTVLSSLPGMIASVQDTSSVLLAVIAAGLVGGLSASPSKDLLATVMVAIAVSTVASGLILTAVGVFKLGGLVRYIPYPVVGGFLAGTGLLLARGSVGAMTDYSLTIANLPHLMRSDQILMWLPGVFFALVLFFGLRYTNHILALPGLLLACLGLFYLALLVSGVSIQEASRLGLLIGGVGPIEWKPFNPALLLHADWTAILGQAGNIAVLSAISLISLLLNATGIELAVKKDMRLDQELRTSGIANLLSGLGGGIIGYHSLSLTILGRRIGGGGRLTGFVAGIVIGAMLFFGASLLIYFPKPLLGGILLFLGLDFLVEWVVNSYPRFSHAEYGVVLLILVVIAVSDFLVGVGVGLAVMVVMFVLAYSQVDVVHHALSGSETQSNVERSTSQRRVLIEHGDQIYVLALQGFIFFGTANAVLERVQKRLDESGPHALRFIIFDLRRVSGVDSSAALSFDKVRQLAEANRFTLALTGTTASILEGLQIKPSETDGARLRIFPDLDHGLEWCEDQILMEMGYARREQDAGLASQLVETGLEPALANRLMAYLEQVLLQPGERLIARGDQADAMYFIESGRLSVYLELSKEKRVRLRTLQRGSSVGEMGLYLNQPRVAAVIAEQLSIAYRLSRLSLEKMEHDEPQLAAQFHAMMVRMLSEMLSLTTRHVEALNK
jgi:SulP family sulfate permease